MQGIRTFLVGLAPGCSDDPATPAADAGADGGPEITCESPGVARCGSACVALGTDPKHCGACDNVCASGLCSNGRCAGECTIDGAKVADGAANPANACEACTTTASTTAWSKRSDGTSCGAGSVCNAGACAAGCYIAGVFHADGSVNPTNACEVCTASASTSAWTPRAAVPLLVGGTDVATQGWTIASTGPATVTYGADYVQLATATTSNVGGALVVHRPATVDPAQPFKVRATVLVQSVSTHNQLDAAAAILGSFSPPGGNGTDRAQMVYLDSAAVGWADDTQSAAFTVTDGAYHVYELAVDAAKVATVSVDGVAKLTRTNFTTNGTIGVGDQTNDPNVDATMRIKSIERVCP